MWAKNPKEVHYPAIIDIKININGEDWSDSDFAIYSVRKDDNNLLFNIRYTYRNNNESEREGTYPVSVQLGTQDICDAVATVEGNIIHVKYNKNLLNTVINNTQDLLNVSSIIKSNEIYSTSELLNAGIWRGFLKRVNCISSDLPESIIIKRIRNKSDAYFYFVAEIDAVSYDYIGESKLYNTIENIKLSNIIFTIDTSLVYGDNYAHVNAIVDINKVYVSSSNSDVLEQKIIDNRNRINLWAKNPKLFIIQVL